MLKLIRPLITFDLETTGTDVEVDRTVQIAATKSKLRVLISLNK